jgi:hypothetical protein
MYCKFKSYGDGDCTIMSILKFDRWENTDGVLYSPVINTISNVDTAPHAISISANVWYTYPNSLMKIEVYPKSINSKFFLMAHISFATGSNELAFRFTRNELGVGVGKRSGASRPQASSVSGFSYGAADGSRNCRTLSACYLDEPRSNGKIVYNIDLMTEAASLYINRTTNFEFSTAAYAVNTASTFTIMEIQ